MARIGVIFGVRRVLYFGIISFILVSIIAGTSNSMQTLLICRFLMGSLSAITYTLPVAIILHIIPQENKAKYCVNLLQSTVGTGLAFGTFIGGMISAYLGWRWIFLINVPFLSISLLCCAFSLPHIKSPSTNDKPDWLGAITLTISIVTLIFSLIEVARLSWISPIIFIPFLISIVFFTIFIYLEKNTSSPIIQLSLFSDKKFLSGLICSAFLSFFYSGVLFITPIYLAFFCHYSSSEIGFIFLSLSLSIIFFTYIQINLIKHISIKSILLLAQILFIITFLFFALINHKANIYDLMIVLVLMGAAWSFTLSPAMMASVSTVNPEQRTSAIGILWTSHGIGGSLGVSIVMIFFHYNLKNHVYNTLKAITNITTLNPAWLQQAVEKPQDAVQIIHANTGLPLHDVTTIFRNSFSFGFTSIFILNILISIFIFITVCFLYKSNNNK